MFRFIRRSKANSLRYEFLPAAEEIVESPPSPFGRIVLWMTTALLVIAGLWMYFGKIDIIASATGKVVPEGNIKVIQPAGQGSIKAIKVSEGQKVTKGQILIEFDATIASATVQALEKTLAVANLEREVAKKIEAGEDPAGIINESQVSEQTKNDLLLLASSQRSVIDIQRELLGISTSQAEAQLATEKQTLQTLETNLTKLQARQQQVEQTPVSPQQQAELQSIAAQSANAQSNIASQKQKITQAESSTVQAQNELQSYTVQASSKQISSIIEQNKAISELEDKLLRAKKELELQTLASPVDGTILTIATTTVGGIATAAQPLVTIVPNDTAMLIEADVGTADIGFVKQGQKVTVKVDTYSFQRYGYLTGTVKNISPDAVTDEKKGPVYKVKISLDQSTTSKSNTIQVIPGMTVTGELVTGQRRIIEFFLDPLITHTDESLKVR